jgi:AcrR family transcriptional regulator
MHKVDRILDAAQTLFAQKGFETTPVSEIATRAEVSPGTVIYYFKSKDNLLFIVTWRVMHTLYKRTMAEVIKGCDPLDCILRSVETFFGFLQYDTVGHSFLLKNTAFDRLDVDAFPEADLKILHQRYVRIIEDQIIAGAASGIFRNTLDSRTTAYGIYALMIGAGRLFLYHDESLPQLEHEVKAFIRGRLGNESSERPSAKASNRAEAG